MATITSSINPNAPDNGTGFGATELVTNTKLDNLGAPLVALTAGTIEDADVSATAGITGSKLADASVAGSKLADASVAGSKLADASVAFAKMTDIIDDDTMATASATKLATSESIKAYVDDAVVDSTTGSLTANGWTKLPNGLIIQWGNNTLTSASGQVITFPIAFTTCFNVMGNRHGNNSTPNLGITSFNNTGITVDPSGSGTFHWQAIGY